MIRDPRLLTSALVAGLLVWAPLPFGSVTAPSRALLTVLVSACLATTVLLTVPVRARAVSIPAVGLLAIAALGIVQSLSWPSGLVRWISPGHWQLAGGPEALATTVPLSLAPQTSQSVALMWCTIAVAGLVGYMVAQARPARLVLLSGLITSAGLQLALGLLARTRPGSSIWGVEVASANGRLRGTFVNPDHLAFYLGLILPLVFAWFLALVRRHHYGRRTRATLVLLIASLALWLLFFVALTLTGSRAGLIAAVLIASAQSLAMALITRKARLAAPGGLLLGAGTLAVFWLNSQNALGRLLETSAYEAQWSARLEAYRVAWQLFLEFPRTGTGLGSFRDAFALHRPEGLEGQWWHAHSDYLELAATTGLFGLVVLAVVVVAVTRMLVSRIRSDARSEVLAGGVGGLGSLGAAALHSAVDFGLTMPANAVTLAIVLALAAGQAESRSRYSRRSRTTTALATQPSLDRESKVAAVSSLTAGFGGRAPFNERSSRT